jgi:lipopolysaccharide transport system ATP-binding protein
MSNYAIEAEGIGKRYVIGTAAERHDTLVNVIAHAAKSPLRALRRRELDETNSFWALRDVSFALKQGEVLGVVGRNGAGKSTLLKVLSRITEPTRGRAQIRGRVGALLEVGTGFHPELTGRENVFLNGSILGMDMDVIKRRFDEIVEFSGVGKFIDTPVKRYSSGMYLRLAFAVAAHLEPDILIVDEVLAVGDAQFQKKCLGQLAEVTSHGRTVLFVSHNMAAVQSLCTRAILLKGGTLVQDGTPREIVHSYLAAGAEQMETREWEGDDAPGGAEFRLRRLRVVQNGEALARVDMSEPFAVELTYDIHESMRDFNIDVVLETAHGDPVLHSRMLLSEDELGTVAPGRYVTRATLPADTLMAGTYWITISANITGAQLLTAVEHVLSFDVEQTDPRMSRVPEGAWRSVLSPRAVRWSSTPDRLLVDGQYV